ncbi:hypothetical protein BBJ28_00004189 [Nothophytophthora sp. Chile5]|nr:hypothetical protein BBJ28_00004189 [Nothophytophthora sp. Chile5]
MSASQRERRRNYEAHESRVYNLTLDINDLRQQVRYLTERRDLHVMRLLLTRQHFERDVLSVVDRILCGFRDEALGLTPSERGFFFSGILPGDVATGGGHGFVLQRGRPLFSHRACAITSIRVLSFVGDDVEADDEEAAELRRLCGGSGGCVVEALGNFTGRITRATITALFPHILCNETLVARLLGLRIACPARLLLYFDGQRRIVQQTVRADMVTALNSLREARPNDFAALMGPSR